VKADRRSLHGPREVEATVTPKSWKKTTIQGIRAASQSECLGKD
jgi:hypothetical protein